MTDSYLTETAVIKTFRLLVVTRIFFGILILSTMAFLLEEPVPLIRLIGLLVFSLLALYLSAPFLETWLQYFYLPIALVITILGSIIEQQILIWRQLYIGQEIEVNKLVMYLVEFENGATPFLNSVDIWIGFLFIPLVIVA
ncbi:MAG: hypothetical protein AAF846_26525 [Chloroflexota bacterium]